MSKAVQLEVGSPNGGCLRRFLRMQLSLRMRLLPRSIVVAASGFSVTRYECLQQCGAGREARRFARVCRTAHRYSDAWLCCFLLQVGGAVREECGGGGGVLGQHQPGFGRWGIDWFGLRLLGCWARGKDAKEQGLKRGMGCQRDRARKEKKKKL